MTVGHVTQRILNIRSVAVVVMGIYVNTINPFYAKFFIICEIKCKKWVISVATAELARHFQQFGISKRVLLLVWDWFICRLFTLDYSRPVQGHFTSNDFGELPQMVFLYIAPIQKWAIWLGLYICFIWIYEPLTLQWPSGDLWLTLMLHDHKVPPLPNPTFIHMVNTPCRFTVTAIIPKHVYFN